MLQRMLLLLAVSCVLLTTAACSAGIGDYAAAQPVIDPFFKTFYEMLGGEGVLGPSISLLFKHGERSYQYTVGALLAYDPEAPANQRFFLLPIGLDLNLSEPAAFPPASPSEYYLGGHLVFDEFVPFYMKLMGEAVVGPPISEMHYNAQKKRFEQHFANLGFYRLESDPPGSVHLLAYGAKKCGSLCPAPLPSEAEVTLPASIDPVFNPVVTRLGIDFTGWALKAAYPTPDGFLEQVLGNLVLIADPAHTERVALRPATVRLGISPDSFENPSGDSNFVFYRIQGELGYNVPRAFLDYLAFHGGLDAAGPPISRFTLNRPNVFRQCFLNLCLEDFRRENYPPLIIPAPLGYTYQDLEIQPVLPTATLSGTAETQGAPSSSPPLQAGFLLQVWERHPVIASGESQVIEVRFLQGNRPLSAIEPELIIYVPEGPQQSYFMPPTGPDGQSLLRVDGISAPNGSLVSYQVCVDLPHGEKHCVGDAYLIAESP